MILKSTGRYTFWNDAREIAERIARMDRWRLDDLCEREWFIIGVTALIEDGIWP